MLTQEGTDYLIQKLREIKPGESIVYFVGYLDYERYSDPSGQNARIADYAYNLYLNGAALLIQERLAPPVRKGGIIDWKAGLGGGFRYKAIGANPKDRKRQIFASPIREGV